MKKNILIIFSVFFFISSCFFGFFYFKKEYNYIENDFENNIYHKDIKKCDISNAKNMSKEEISNFFMNYYLKKNPKQIPLLITSISNENLIDEHNLYSSATFLSEIFKQNPNKISQWVSIDLCELEVLSSDAQDLVILGLWISDSDIGKIVLNNLLNNNQLNKKNYISNLLNHPLPNNLEKEIPQNPEDIDILWAYFFATGNESYVKRIIEISKMTEKDFVSSNNNSALAMAIIEAAKWSLDSVAKNHSKVKEILKKVN